MLILLGVGMVGGLALIIMLKSSRACLHVLSVLHACNLYVHFA